MQIQNLLYRKDQNVLQDAGDLDGQIMADLRALRDHLAEYQEHHLEAKCQDHPSYEKWSGENRKKLAWLDRLIEAAEKGMSLEPRTPSVPKRITQEGWDALLPKFREPLALAMAIRETKQIREYLPETVYVEKQSFHPDDWYLWSVAACRDEGADRVWDCWTLNLTTGGMNGGHYGLTYQGLRDALASKKGARVCGPGEYPAKIDDKED